MSDHNEIFLKFSVVLVTAPYLDNTEGEIAQKGLEREQELIKEVFLLFTTTQQALLRPPPSAVLYLGFAADKRLCTF